MAAAGSIPIRIPMLRWAGSKRKLLPHLVRSVGRFERYVEPFAGSACLFFALQPKSAILGDFNNHLIQTYKTVRDHPETVGRKVNDMPPTKKFYYELRSRQPDSFRNPVDRAARFIYLNRFCFNGVYRTNRRGEFNVPRGVRTGRIPPLADFLRWAEALKSTRLVTGDFEQCLVKVRHGDFVYLDPPYTKDGIKYSGEYGYGSFGETDLTRLRDWLHRIDAKHATFLFSYRYTRGLAAEFSCWHTRIVAVRRHVAGFLKSRVVVKELLVSNKPLPR